MAQQRKKFAFGPTPTQYGFASLIFAGLACASWPLIMVVGIFLAACIIVPLGIISILSALVGIGTGLYDKNLTAVVTGAIGLAVTCSFAVWMLSNIMRF